MSRLTSAVLRIAAGEVGVRELGRNRGQRVEEYQAAAGAHPGDPWCACFVSWCFAKAAAELGLENPMHPTAGALKIWRESLPELRSGWPGVGSIFIIDHGGGLGHCGIVEAVMADKGYAVTIEGNTSLGGSREGDGVYRRVRHLDEVTVGYVHYGRGNDAEPVG